MNNLVIYGFQTIGAILFFCIFKLLIQLIFGNHFEFFLTNYWAFVAFGLIPAFISICKGYSSFFFLFWIIGTWTPILSIIFVLGLDDKNSIDVNSETKQSIIEQEPQETVVCFKGRITNDKGEPVEGAKITVEEKGLACNSDISGNFSINLESPESSGVPYWIKITKDGYKNIFYHYVATNNEPNNFELQSLNN